MASRQRDEETAAVPRIALTPGEPAGIGPDLCLGLAQVPHDVELVAIADPALLRERAAALGLAVELPELDPGAPPHAHRAGTLPVLAVARAAPTTPGRGDPANAGYVLETLRRAVEGCMDGRYDALVTGPVHKGLIAGAGHDFRGHTEYLAALAGAAEPVMMLIAPGLRVALLTTHLPLRDVPAAVTTERLTRTLRVVDHDLRARFGIEAPRILVCGLNPHAGEGGLLGHEESTIIEPALDALRSEGLRLEGPVPADTAFTPRRLEGADAVLALYHDQGLPVLKHHGFGRAVNVTLGLPFVRTSVDHGTAFELAGTGRAEGGSLAAALELAGGLARTARRAHAATG